MQIEHIQLILNRGRWFSNLPAPLKQWLLDYGQLKNLTAGQRLFSRGDQADGIYAVLKGSMQVVGASKFGAEDKQVMLTLIDPPDWFGEICLFDRQPRTHDALADSACTLFHVRQGMLDMVCQEHPQYWRDFGLLLTQKVRLIFGAIEDAALLPTPIRLARRILLMAEGYGIRADSGQLSSRVLHVSQDKLSDMLAVSRQTINQILKEIEGEGILALRRGSIEIMSMDLLRDKSHIK